MNSGELAGAVLGWVVGAAVGLWILYLIIRGAVRSALRGHHEWVESTRSVGDERGGRSAPGAG